MCIRDSSSTARCSHTSSGTASTGRGEANASVRPAEPARDRRQRLLAADAFTPWTSAVIRDALAAPEPETLPLLDEHREQVGVPADVAWTALVGVLRRRMGGARSLARVLGCDPMEATAGFSGRLGETLPGFRVVESEPGRRLALRGRPAAPGREQRPLL